MDVTATELCAQIDRVWDCFVRLKALVPYTEKALAGATSLKGAPYYRKHGQDVEFVFAEPLTEDRIAQINESGRWLNENYIVRLHAILELHDALPYGQPVDTARAGASHVSLLKGLRHRIAHDDGCFDASDPRHQHLAQEIKDLYEIDPSMNSDHFHLPVDKVLEPMTRKAKEYVKDLE